jgi:hypothetical protein
MIFVPGVLASAGDAAMDEMESRIRAALSDFWDERAVPGGPSGPTTVDELIEPIESMTAVEVLVTLDELTGHKLPNSVIQAGGYGTKEEFMDKLTANVLAHVQTKP